MHALSVGVVGVLCGGALLGAAPARAQTAADTATGPASVSSSCSDVAESVRRAMAEASEAMTAGAWARANARLAAAQAELPSCHWLTPTVNQLGILSARMAGGAVTATGGLATMSREDESVAGFYTTATVFGLYTGIWAFGVMLDADARTGVPLAVATAGAGFGAAYALDHREGGLRGATADGISGGLLLGASEGALLLLSFGTEASSKSVASTIWGSALAGGLAGGLLAGATNASRGDVSLATSAYGWGAALGACGVLASNATDGKTISQVILASSTLGLGIGALAASYSSMSPSRVLYINLGGLGGSLVGLAVGAATSMDTRSQWGATMGIAYAGGLAAGAWLTRNVDALSGETALAVQASPGLVAQLDPGKPPAPGMLMQLIW